MGSDPITGTSSTSQLVGLHLRNPSLMDHYSDTESETTVQVALGEVLPLLFQPTWLLGAQ